MRVDEPPFLSTATNTSRKGAQYVINMTDTAIPTLYGVGNNVQKYIEETIYVLWNGLNFIQDRVGRSYATSIGQTHSGAL